MPVVRINDATFAHISTLKTWFGTETPGETIDCIVRVAMKHLDIEPSDEVTDAVASTTDGSLIFNAAPSLEFTKPVTATVKGKQIQNPNWASIRRAIFSQIQRKGCRGEKLLQELGRRFKSGNHQAPGYTYSPELDISIPGLSAPDAWKEIDRLAKKWRIPVEVTFEWDEDPKAKHPGEKGVIRSGGFQV